jgi:hypothetical protein
MSGARTIERPVGRTKTRPVARPSREAESASHSAVSTQVRAEPERPVEAGPYRAVLACSFEDEHR